MTPLATLYFCASCRRSGACSADTTHLSLESAFQRADLADRFRLSAADCLGTCDAPMVIALQGQGRASYVFSGIELPDDLEDIVATCRAYLASPAGWIEDARPCGRLRYCLRTRVPAPEAEETQP